MVVDGVSLWVVEGKRKKKLRLLFFRKVIDFCCSWISRFRLVMLVGFWGFGLLVAGRCRGV